MTLPKLLPTTVVGSYPPPEWLVDRERLTKAVARNKDAALWRIPEPYLAAAQDEPMDSPMDMVRHLRANGRLTPALLLRALLSGDRSLFEAALAELSGLPLARAAGFVRFHQGGGFAALYDRAKMPTELRTVFKAALAAQDEAGETWPAAEPRLSRRLIGRVLQDCSRVEGAGLAKVITLLRRFDSEAARQDARELTARIATAQPGLLAAPAPACEDEEQAPRLALAPAF